MDLRNCDRCGKAYVYTGRPLCVDCAQDDEEDFALLREMLRDTKHYTVQELSEQSGIGEEKIIRFLREGRLTAAIDAGLTLECAVCGRRIDGGRLCSECAQKIKSNLDGFQAEPTRKQDQGSAKAGRMHIADRLKKRRRR